ncbi:MAG: uracil-xanthine permease, partial [Firmicutes bacterium]|nr:uracil-xanthine permease [Bacillota bacterium]
ACNVFGKKMVKMIPFIIGIVAGYVLAAIFTAIGFAANIDALKIIDFSKFESMTWVPDFTFLTAFKGFGDLTPSYIVTLLAAYAPVSFVVFAEHIADHKNLSSIIERDLLKEPGLDRTLLGDGIGSFCGAFFGGCPNTTYGESVGCVAISGNASIITIWYTAVLAIVISFFGPFATFLSTIPSCVMGGVCFALYGFIAVSGLKMIQNVDLNEHPNMFVVSVILIAGIGGMSLNFGSVTITEVACALILGIITNVVLRKKKA